MQEINDLNGFFLWKAQDGGALHARNEGEQFWVPHLKVASIRHMDGESPKWPRLKGPPNLIDGHLGILSHLRFYHSGPPV